MFQPSVRDPDVLAADEPDVRVLLVRHERRDEPGGRVAVAPRRHPGGGLAPRRWARRSRLNEWPPSVEEYIVPSVYSPTSLLAFCGSTITSKPSPPAGSTIWLLPVAEQR